MAGKKTVRHSVHFTDEEEAIVQALMKARRCPSFNLLIERLIEEDAARAREPAKRKR